MQMECQVKGYLNIALALTFLTYYTLWVIGLPFVDTESAYLVDKLFPPVEIALGVPCLVFGIIFLGLLCEAYYMVCRDRRIDKTI